MDDKGLPRVGPTRETEVRAEAGAGAEFAAPRVYGNHVYLRPVTPNDYPVIQAMELGGDLATRWRFRGSTPSPEQWLRTLWSDVLAQHLVVERRENGLVGLALAYRPNFQDGHAYLGAVRFGPRTHSPLMLLGVGIFIHYVFTCWPFRKLYFETTEYNYSQFASGAGDLFEVEGRLREHRFVAGRYWDELILGISREHWMSRGERLVDIECPRDVRRVHLRRPPRTRRAR